MAKIKTNLLTEEQIQQYIDELLAAEDLVKRELRAELKKVVIKQAKPLVERAVKQEIQAHAKELEDMVTKKLNQMGLIEKLSEQMTKEILTNGLYVDLSEFKFESKDQIREEGYEEGYSRAYDDHRC